MLTSRAAHLDDVSEILVFAFSGVDEQSVIDILTRRSYEQRREIAFEYERLAKKVRRRRRRRRRHRTGAVPGRGHMRCHPMCFRTCRRP